MAKLVRVEQDIRPTGTPGSVARINPAGDTVEWTPSTALTEYTETLRLYMVPNDVVSESLWVESPVNVLGASVILSGSPPSSAAGAVTLLLTKGVSGLLVGGFTNLELLALGRTPLALILPVTLIPGDVITATVVSDNPDLATGGLAVTLHLEPV